MPDVVVVMRLGGKAGRSESVHREAESLRRDPPVVSATEAWWNPGSGLQSPPKQGASAARVAWAGLPLGPSSV
jgi:hypothetical protein